MVLAKLPAPRDRRPTPPVSIPRTPTVGEVEPFLRALIADLEVTGWAAPAHRGRPPILPALALWGGLLSCVLHGWSTQTELWRRLSQYGLWDYRRLAISDQAVYHRLARDGTQPLEELFAAVTALLADRLRPYAQHHLAPFASGVYAVDSTTLDPLARRLADLKDLSARERLAGKLAGLFDVRRQQWVRLLDRAAAVENDKGSARDLVAELPTGSLLLFDLGYFAFRWFDELTDAGQWWVSRLRASTSYEIAHVCYEAGDTLEAIVWLGAHRADRAKHAVRLVQFRQGGVVRRYITNVLDPHRLPMALVAELYARRWDFEMAAQLLKQHLGLRLRWSSKRAVVLQQVWAVLIIAQIVQALRLEIAGRAGVDVFEVSLPLLVAHLPRFAAKGYDPVAEVVAAGVRWGFIRPSRRTQITAPVLDPAHVVPPPEDLVLIRTPRYAGKL
jgi:Transposase DDE domain